MQEPQYRSDGVKALLDAVGKSRVPCMSIMNMPPLPYIKRIPGLDHNGAGSAYTDPRVWDWSTRTRSRSTARTRRRSARPTAKPNELLVTLPTNFKCARFEDDKDTQIVRNLEKDVEAARFDAPEGKIELPVKLRAYDSIWSARQVGDAAGRQLPLHTKDGMRTAQEAVHTDIEESRSVYNFVFDLCVKLGAKPVTSSVRNMRPRRRA